MNVCILTTSFPLKKGDISGMFVLEQARHLVELGAEVHVVAPHHHGAPFREGMKGINVTRFRYFLPGRLQKLCYGSGIPNNLREFAWVKVQLPFLLLFFTMQAIRHVRRCDVVHAHWSIAGLAGLLAAKTWGKPIVLNMHQGTTRNLSIIENFLLEQVDYLVTNSSYTLSHVMKSARPRAAGIIPPGVDTRRFQPLARTGEARSLLPEKSRAHPIIFSLGRLVEWKGHTHLIEALRLLSEEPVPHLLIGGEGTLRQDLGRQVREKGLEDRVTFLDHIPGSLVASYYSLADVYTQPSIIDRDGTTEGLGVTLLEAMACGVPCVASRVGGIPDIIDDGENGFLVEPGNPHELAEKIGVLLRDEGLRRNMGEKGRLFVEEKYSWKAKARELMEIYRGILRRRHGGLTEEGGPGRWDG